MWGWKTVEKTIEPSVSLSQALAILKSEGFEERVSNESHVILDRKGTELTTQGARFPMELAVATKGKGLFLQLRYDGFVLFDTGDLQQLGDELASKLATK